MSSENGEVYIMSDEDDDEWVSPTPAQTAIVEAVTEATDLSAGDVDDIEEYVDLADLRTTLEDDGEALTFTVEDHEVTVDADGDITVD